MIPSEFVVSSSDFQVRHISSLATLCLVILEYVGTCQFEFSYVWRRPITTPKVAFVVSRYYDLTGKIVHYSLIHLILGRSPNGVSPKECAVWFSLLSAQCTIMIISLDVILFLRVYALYQKSRGILLLGVPIAVPWVVGIYTHWYWVVNYQRSFDEMCNVFYEGVSLILGTAFSTSFVISHVLICVFAYAKRNIGRGHVPVVRLVINEGTWVFVVLFAIVAATSPVDVALKVLNPFFHFVCPPTLVSILTCRIIRNMYSLEVSTAEDIATGHEFCLTTPAGSEVGTEDGRI